MTFLLLWGDNSFFYRNLRRLLHKVKTCLGLIVRQFAWSNIILIFTQNTFIIRIDLAFDGLVLKSDPFSRLSIYICQLSLKLFYVTLYAPFLSFYSQLKIHLLDQDWLFWGTNFTIDRHEQLLLFSIVLHGRLQFIYLFLKVKIFPQFRLKLILFIQDPIQVPLDIILIFLVLWHISPISSLLVHNKQLLFRVEIFEFSYFIRQLLFLVLYFDCKLCLGSQFYLILRIKKLLASSCDRYSTFKN